MKKIHIVLLVALSVVLGACQSTPKEQSSLVRQISVILDEMPIVADLEYDDAGRLVYYVAKSYEIGHEDAAMVITMPVSYEEDGSVVVQGQHTGFRYHNDADGNLAVDISFEEGDWEKFDVYTFEDGHVNARNNDYLPHNEIFQWKDGNMVHHKSMPQVGGPQTSDFVYSEKSAPCNIAFWRLGHPAELISESSLDFLLIPQFRSANLIASEIGEMTDWETDKMVPWGKSSYDYEFDEAGRVIAMTATTVGEGSQGDSEYRWEFTY